MGTRWQRLGWGAMLAGGMLAGLVAPALAQAPGQSRLTFERPLEGAREEEEGVGVEERVGEKLPLDLPLTDSTGKQRTLGEFFPGASGAADDRPAIILLVYYRCPIVCDVFMDKSFEVLNKVSYDMGKDYRVLVVSFDPGETPDVAAQRKQLYATGFRRDLTAEELANVEFFVGDASSVRTLADALGYQYKRLENGEYSHPVATFLATPDGTIARYLYGYPTPESARNYTLALMESSEGKLVRSVGERLMAFCYMFDPSTGMYTLQAFRVMQLGGGMTIVLLGGLIGAMLVRERMRRRAAAKLAGHGSGPGSGPASALASGEIDRVAV